MSNVRRIRERHNAKPAAATTPWKDDYWTLASRPLHGFIFVLPLIALYELGSIFYLHDTKSGTLTRIKAESLIQSLFQSFGVFGLLVPGIAVLTVLLIWHVVSKDRWVVRPVVVIGMFFEAALWVLPLVVLAAIVMNSALPRAAALEPLAAAQHALRDEPWQVRATISVGAGIYEELVFRLAGLSLLHFLFKDILELKPAVAATLAILVTSLVFAGYHPAAMELPGLAPWTWYVKSWTKFTFFAVAGVYFAAIYLYRGFGVAVGTHAMYDLAVLVLFDSARG